MKEEQVRKEGNILNLLILLLPILTLPILTDCIESSIPILALKMILGLLGGAIGSSLFWLTKDRDKPIKYAALGLIILGFVGTLIFFSNKTDSEKRKLFTCQICGYKAIEKIGEQCAVCIAEINTEYATSEGYTSIKEMIKEEQLFFFAMEENLTFSKPAIFKDLKNEFRKDAKWQPIVTPEEVSLRKKEMDEIGK